MEKMVGFFKQKARQKRFLIPCIAVTLLCCLAVISGLNKPHLNPFDAGLVTQHPTEAVYSDYGSEMIDRGSRRLLILNGKGKLKTVVNAGSAGSPVQWFDTVNMYGDKIFVTGAETYNLGMYRSSEKIIEYDSNGKSLRTVYSETYTEDEKVSCRRFADVCACRDGLYLTKVVDREITVLLLSDESGARTVGNWTVPEAVYTAHYIPDGNYCFVACLSQNCYIVECETGKITAVTLEDYASGLLSKYNISPDTVDVETLENAYNIPNVVLNENGKVAHCTLINTNGGSCFVLSKGAGRQWDISVIPYTFGLRIMNIGYWLAVGILGLEAAFLLVFCVFARGSSKTRRVLLFIAAAALISVFYTSRIRLASDESYTKSLKTQAEQISYILSEDYGDIFKSIGEKGIISYCADPDNQAKTDRFRGLLKNLCNKNDSTQSCYAECFLYDPDGELCTFADSCNRDIAGLPLDLSPDLKAAFNESKTGTLTTESYYQNVIYDYEGIYANDGTLVGYLLLYMLRDNLLYVQKQKTVNMTVSLLAILISMYMLVTVTGTFSADIRRRRARSAADAEARGLDMVGILSFVQGWVYALDASIIVYVAKSLCDGFSAAKVAFLVSLPITAGMVGNMLGLAALDSLRRRIGERSSAMLSVGITVLTMLLLAFSVYIHNIYLYIVGTFIRTFFADGMFFGLLETLPYRAKETEDRNAIKDSVTKGSVAAEIIAALVGGYISQYLSYTAVYILDAGVCLLLMFMCALCFVKNDTGPVRTESEIIKEKGKHWAFFLKGPGLVFTLLYLLPWMVTGGYKNYLFPLYSANCGISPLLLSNLSVFVMAFSYFSYSRLRKIGDRMGNTAALLVPQFVVCGCLICFVLSPNIYWAIAMMFVYETVQNIVKSSSFVYLNEIVECSGLDARQTCENSLQIRNIFKSIRTPILSAAVILGMDYACTAVGAACGAMFGIFLFFEDRRKKKRMRKEQKE